MPWREGKIGILVVDDEPSVLLTYGAILKKHGYAAMTAISSVEACELLDNHEFDLLLCDYSLEKRHTGFEVIDHARARRPGQKALLLTGYASLETADQAIAMGVPVLYKPIDLQELFKTIEQTLESSNGTDASEENQQAKEADKGPQGTNRSGRNKRGVSQGRRAAG
jgi:DNA-binding NtrC family response regulator